MENIKQTVEALIFASGNPLSKKDLVDKIPALTTRELNGILEELKHKYGGDSGILLLTFNDKIQFSTNPKYGEVVADVLTPIKERELSKSLLEVLAIIAYRQPITRSELEAIRQVESVEYQITMLSKCNLIEIVGRKETVGRPVLFGTSDEFLKRFQLNSLADLPDYQQVLERIALFDQNYNEKRDTLYSNRTLFNNGEQPDEIIVEPAVRIPDILKPIEPENKLAVNDEEGFFSDDDDDDEFLMGDDIQTIE